MLPAFNLHASDELSCTIDVLDQLGWKTVANSQTTRLENTDACDTNAIPVFNFNQTTENIDSLLSRSKDALYSVTSKCLFNRSYQSAVSASITKLTDNLEFEFLPPGNDPRDPFLPPEGGAARAGLVLYVSPLYTAIIAWWLLSEPPHWYHVLGACLILPGMYLAMKQPQNGANNLSSAPDPD